ncbi:MAG: hypothetical protein AB7C95_04685 [Synergistaceae bacterium]
MGEVNYFVKTELKRLCDYYGKNMPESQAEIWLKDLTEKGFSAKTMKSAVAEISTQSQKFPSFSELLSTLMRYHVEAPEREYVKGCKKCSNGLVTVVLKNNDHWFPTVFRCNCSASANWAQEIKSISEHEITQDLRSGVYFREYENSGDYICNEYLEYRKKLHEPKEAGNNSTDEIKKLGDYIKNKEGAA